MKTAAVLVASILALGTMLWAADDAVMEPQEAASLKLQAPGLGTEAIAIPQVLSYQGRLTDATGVPVANGDYRVTFNLYAAPEDGSPFWQETQKVTTRDGMFSVLLGSVTSINAAPAATAAYLGMAVEGDAEMMPRLRIAGAAHLGLSNGVPPVDADDAWVRIGSDSVLYTIRRLGIVRGGSSNVLYGTYGYTQTIFGSSCTTGASGANVGNISIGGGYGNRAWAPFTAVCGGRNNKAGDAATDTSAIVVGGYGNRATGKFAYVAGGQNNTASGVYAAVGGGYINAASGLYATVSGGDSNIASGTRAVVGGGQRNTANDWDAVVCGGYGNTAGNDATVSGGANNVASGFSATVGGGGYDSASGSYATVGGGYYNTASEHYATVGGGDWNQATAEDATVSGGYDNSATATGATVAGGWGCDVAALRGFAAGYNSDVATGHDNSAAFNGQTTTASAQTRVGALSKASGTFTIDHPLDPNGKILNHYFVESPDMSNVYSGSVVLNAAGRGEVRLPDYFDALNRNPRVQLTGVGTTAVVYVAEDISGNRFVVGGKPGTKVYWQVTGDRKDPSAEITRIIMPVEQPKTGQLAGHSLDDDFLRSTKDQLDRMGVGGQFDFRTTAGRKLYEEMKHPAKKHGGTK